ncbi:hypothetical protein ACLOJK_027698 [Asimina triloba]
MLIAESHFKEVNQLLKADNGSGSKGGKPHFTLLIQGGGEGDLRPPKVVLRLVKPTSGRLARGGRLGSGIIDKIEEWRNGIRGLQSDEVGEVVHGGIGEGTEIGWALEVMMTL